MDGSCDCGVETRRLTACPNASAIRSDGSTTARGRLYVRLNWLILVHANVNFKPAVHISDAPGDLLSSSSHCDMVALSMPQDPWLSKEMIITRYGSVAILVVSRLITSKRFG